jgi:hypothetical protein
LKRWLAERGAVLLLGLAPLALLSPLLLGGKALFWGTPALQFVPWREFAWQALRQGELPLWNPLSGMGAPLFANYQVALVYPPTWLLFILSALGGIELHAWGQALLVLFHWVVAAVGMVSLARLLGLGILGQIIAGLAYSLGGYLVTRAGFLSINAATAWVPWVLLLSARLASDRFRGGKPRSRLLVALSLVVALQLLCGHAQTAWYTCVLAFIWAGYWAAADDLHLAGQAPHALKPRLLAVLKTWMWLAGAYLCGAALAGIQLLPTAEYLLQSQRAEAVDLEYALTYSYWPWRLLTLLAPDLFGSPVQGNYWGYANYWEDALYIGVLPLLLALAAGIGWLVSALRGMKKPSQQEPVAIEHPPKRQVIPVLLLVIVIAFVLALGKNTPVFPWLYRYVPTFDMFQAPARFTLWAAVSLALLAAVGADAWRRPRKRALYWTRLGTAGAAAVTIGAGLAWYFMGEVSPTFIRATALAGLWGVGAGLLSLSAPPADSGDASPWWRWAVLLFVAADLVYAGWGMNPGIALEFYSREPVTAGSVSQMLAGRRLYLRQDIEQALKFDRFLRFDSFDPGEDWMRIRETYLPNLNMLDGFPAVNNFDPLVPARFAVWMEALAQAQFPVVEHLLDLSGAGAVEVLDPSRHTGVHFEPVPEQAGARARWVACGKSVPDGAAALAALGSDSFDTEQTVVIEGEIGDVEDACPGDSTPGSVTWIESTPGQITIDVEASQAGWLLLSDAWYPGWTVRVDGAAQPVHRADYLFRGVAVQAGSHRVEFEYQPVTLWLGALLSLAALAGIGGLWFFSHRQHASS